MIAPDTAAEKLNRVLRADHSWIEGRKLDPQPDKVRAIYVITIGEGISKIGIAYRPVERCAGLQAANPTERLDLAFVEKAPQPVIHRAERRAHAALSNFAMGNEWFRVSRDTAIAAVKEALVYERSVPRK